MADLNSTQFPPEYTQQRLFDVQPMAGIGVERGDPNQPLYRMMRLGSDAPSDPAGMLEFANRKRTATEGGGINHRLGIHWTHDLDQANDWFNNEDEDDRPAIFEAYHPGPKHVMDYDNEDGRPIMERTIAPRGYGRSVLDEVPIRPGAPLTMRAVHTASGRGDLQRHRLPATRAQA